VDLTLARDAPGSPQFGRLSFGPPVPLQTLELPWSDASGDVGGDAGASCVPAGVYELVLHDTPTHPQTWALVNPALGVYHEPGDVPPGQPGRTAVLIHPGNTEADSKGCILVGMSRGTVGGEPAVDASVEAFGRLKAAVPWTVGHTLTITEPSES
jgi:Family of unknown function (DUF5675)